MAKNNLFFKNEDLVRLNVRNGFYGIAIGILINVFFSIASGHLITNVSLILNILFSFFITLSITNSVLIYDRFVKSENISLWLLLSGYYACNFVGLIIGTELTYIIVSLIFGTRYNPMDHLHEYKFNFSVAMVAGTAMLIYQLQRINMQEKLSLKEMELIRSKQLRTQAELQTLQAKINPHFLYNALNSIASLIHTDAEKAEQMTVNLSSFFRYSIKSSQDNLITVRQEMEMLETYLAIEKIRFGKRISFCINVPEILNQEMIPRFLVQPLVENALKHGLKDQLDGKLSIGIFRKESQLQIDIADNGSAFPEEMNMGYGLQSIYDKLKLIYPDNFQVHIFNKPEKLIRILIPATLTL